MKLDKYVQQTLLDITNGVKEAQKQTHLYIAPGFIEGQKVTTPQMVTFEIVVTVNKEAGGGISVWSMADVKAGASSEHTNKISFEVPVYFQAPTELNENHHSRLENKGDKGSSE